MSHPNDDLDADESANLAVYIGLLCLTALTLAASLAGNGRIMAVALALIVASAKAGLIGFYYMDLRRERTFMVVLLAIGLLAVAVLLVGILPDLSFFPK
ncbi:MAG TPA: cytochrome C oxidase subunit IV family protein [Elusimicrobiota bacterium]|jgi:caa(3)-type oxidase subunit IV|nr:cytochrome C oxidase subunit IV family protein [Elusimicrobiota bacterium]